MRLATRPKPALARRMVMTEATRQTQGLVWIGYTTRYRTGGAALRRAAEDLARRHRRAGARVRCRPVERKAAFTDEMARLARDGERITELHLLSHSGVYGPMFGTTQWPEQLSPHEWRRLQIPFAEGGQAFFHACRTARWFAPFFARTFGVTTHGNHWYTTFSGSPERFRPPPWRDPAADVYLVGFPGRTSHGMLATLGKYSGVARAETMKRFEAATVAGEDTYNSVAPLYDRVFDDISVRTDEVAWLEAHLPPGRPRVLDLGCGNGALLHRWAGRIAQGTGIDASPGMLALATARNATHGHLRFHACPEPTLPLPDQSVDVAVSLLSFRYLDWDPMMAELKRVLVPGGRLLVVDMAARAPKASDWPRLLWDKARTDLRARRRPAWRRDLAVLVGDPRWQAMLQYNPMRAEHEYIWYLQSRFPGRKVEVLNIGRTARILAFDSGPMSAMQDVALTWP